MRPGELLWTPGPERIRRANVTAFADWLARERGKSFADSTALWRWSVEDLEGFWQALWDYFRIESSAPHTRVLGRGFDTEVIPKCLPEAFQVLDRPAPQSGVVRKGHATL